MPASIGHLGEIAFVDALLDGVAVAEEVLEGADHMFDVLREDSLDAREVIATTAGWLQRTLS